MPPLVAGLLGEVRAAKADAFITAPAASGLGSELANLSWGCDAMGRTAMASAGLLMLLGGAGNSLLIKAA